ncbi:unnamed protein product [Paramecium sonneborni]|uniref:Transmembrane protein n=1 Tax=Paramecium sonneborni TaxID=65129 RepID=A0A8S1RV97_9CILI|nr:unnamed protein product [Paramecium sonneborni]
MQLLSQMKSCSENYFINYNITFNSQIIIFKIVVRVKKKIIILKLIESQINNNDQNSIKTKFYIKLDDQALTNAQFKQIMNQLCKKFEYDSIPPYTDSIQKSNLLEQTFLVLFAIFINTIIIQGTLQLIQNFQFKNILQSQRQNYNPQDRERSYQIR